MLIRRSINFCATLYWSITIWRNILQFLITKASQILQHRLLFSYLCMKMLYFSIFQDGLSKNVSNSVSPNKIFLSSVESSFLTLTYTYFCTYPPNLLFLALYPPTFVLTCTISTKPFFPFDLLLICTWDTSVEGNVQKIKRLWG